MKAVWAIYRANFREYARNPAVLAFTVIMPLLLAVFLSLIMGNQELSRSTTISPTCWASH